MSEDQHSDFNESDLAEEIKEPNMWAVVLLNDDFTPMDFVDQVLQQEFGHPIEQAQVISTMIHNMGRGVAGIYTKDICLTKIDRVHNWAKGLGFPLLPIAEEQFK